MAQLTVFLLTHFTGKVNGTTCIEETEVIYGTIFGGGFAIVIALGIGALCAREYYRLRYGSPS